MVLLIVLLIQIDGSYKDFVQKVDSMEVCNAQVEIYKPDLVKVGLPYTIGCFEILRPA